MFRRVPNRLTRHKIPIFKAGTRGGDSRKSLPRVRAGFHPQRVTEVSRSGTGRRNLRKCKPSDTFPHGAV
jgi:hypothetical protein